MEKNCLINYDERARKTSVEIIKLLSKFIPEFNLLLEQFKFQVEHCEYDDIITIDAETAMNKLGVFMASLMTYWDSVEISFPNTETETGSKDTETSVTSTSTGFTALFQNSEVKH